MESGVWRSGVGEWECGEAQGMSSGMSPELDTESGTGRDKHEMTHSKEEATYPRSRIGSNPYYALVLVALAKMSKQRIKDQKEARGRVNHPKKRKSKIRSVTWKSMIASRWTKHGPWRSIAWTMET